MALRCFMALFPLRALARCCDKTLLFSVIAVLGVATSCPLTYILGIDQKRGSWDFEFFWRYTSPSAPRTQEPEKSPFIPQIERAGKVFAKRRPSQARKTCWTTQTFSAFLLKFLARPIVGRARCLLGGDTNRLPSSSLERQTSSAPGLSVFTLRALGVAAGTPRSLGAATSRLCRARGLEVGRRCCVPERQRHVVLLEPSPISAGSP